MHHALGVLLVNLNEIGHAPGRRGDGQECEVRDGVGLGMQAALAVVQATKALHKSGRAHLEEGTHNICFANRQPTKRVNEARRSKCWLSDKSGNTILNQ